jgi:hypothetical protein
MWPDTGNRHTFIDPIHFTPMHPPASPGPDTDPTEYRVSEQEWPSLSAPGQPNLTWNYQQALGGSTPILYPESPGTPVGDAYGGSTPLYPRSP